MKACVTGATGFLGAHVARLLDERGHEVRVGYRNPDRLSQLKGVSFKRAKTDILDLGQMRRAVRGTDVLFHCAGYVGSNPVDRVWAMNARGPRVAVEAAAAEGVPRVVVTSTISAIGTADDGGPADEAADYPEDGLGLTYADAKHQGEEEALEAGRGFGVEVLVVNPAYVLGVPVDDSQPGETSTRTVGGYLRGRLPGVIDAPMNFVDVEDAALGHLLAAERGTPGERYILGGHNIGWVEFIDSIADIADVHHPMLVLPAEIARVARLRESLRLPGIMAAEGLELMSKDWRFSSEKARRELGYEPRPLDETLRATVEWYQRLISDGAFDDEEPSGLSRASDVLRVVERLGLLSGLQVAQRVAGRRLVAGT